MGEGRRVDGARAETKRRLTVPEAAAELGTTSEGVRSRIKRGTIETERESGRVWVILEGAHRDRTPPQRETGRGIGRSLWRNYARGWLSSRGS